jgi:hypothetical protein
MRSALILALPLVVACGSSPKKASADFPIPPDDATSKPDDAAPKWDSTSTKPEPSAKPGAVVNEKGARRMDQYDKDATEVVLKRAARQVKDNCGGTTDEDGKATGPWGKVTVQVKLGRNGHSKGADVPAPHGDKPVGKCIANAFANLTFPPWSGEDTTIPWEVELVEPKAEAPKKK